mmetsp:Transcript_30676/g.56438  ORF Transcript_30676/g.56438 Transcript_30676/m.56438 type:complete len:253 (+) Transcript_30676:571-1329(+)
MPLQVELQLGRIAALRVVVEVPVAVVVQVVDAEGGAPLAVDLPQHAQVGGGVLADAHVGKAVHVGVVQRAVLAAAVARGEAGAPLLVEAVGGQCGGAPARDVGLPLSHRVARRRDETGIGLDLGVGVGDAARQVQALEPPVGGAQRGLQAGGADLVDVLHAADVLVGRGVEAGLRVQRIARGLGEQGQPGLQCAPARLGAELAGPGFLGLEIGVVDELRVGGRRGAVELADRGHAHRAAERGLQHHLGRGLP